MSSHLAAGATRPSRRASRRASCRPSWRSPRRSSTVPRRAPPRTHGGARALGLRPGPLAQRRAKMGAPAASLDPRPARVRSCPSQCLGNCSTAELYAEWTDDCRAEPEANCTGSCFGEVRAGPALAPPCPPPLCPRRPAPALPAPRPAWSSRSPRWFPSPSGATSTWRGTPTPTRTPGCAALLLPAPRPAPRRTAQPKCSPMLGGCPAGVPGARHVLRRVRHHRPAALPRRQLHRRGQRDVRRHLGAPAEKLPHASPRTPPPRAGAAHHVVPPALR
jgi:hypothetical protein